MSRRRVVCSRGRVVWLVVGLCVLLGTIGWTTQRHGPPQPPPAAAAQHVHLITGVSYCGAPCDVAGAAGFIGFSLATALLARGDIVLGLDNLDPYYDVRLKLERIKMLQNNAAFHFVEGGVPMSCCHCNTPLPSWHYRVTMLPRAYRQTCATARCCKNCWHGGQGISGMHYTVY